MPRGDRKHTLKRGETDKGHYYERFLSANQINMVEVNVTGGQSGAQNGKKKIILNAFDMSTVGHLSPGQWKVSTKKSDLQVLA